jgi:uncharacterized membrane protein
MSASAPTVQPLAAQPRRRSGWFPWSRHAHPHPALQAMHDDRTFGERVADNVASFGGSWPFIFLFLGLMAAWIVLNTVLLQRVVHHKAFDPYPYIALNLVLSGLAGLQAPIIMMSQNRAATKDEMLASRHYEETQQGARLLAQNTELTQQVHDLAAQIRQLTEEVRGRVCT